MANYGNELAPTGLPMPPERWSEVAIKGGILAVKHQGEVPALDEIEPLVLDFIDSTITMPLPAKQGAPVQPTTAGELYDIKSAPGDISRDDIREMHPNRSDALHMITRPSQAVIYLARTTE